MNARDVVTVAELIEDPAAPQQRIVVLSNASLDVYLADYAQQYCEYVEGDIVAVRPVSLRHEQLRNWLRMVFQAHLSLIQAGIVLGSPFIMHVERFPMRRREPDLMIVLNDSLSLLLDTELAGPADIVIEIVSEATGGTDYGDKFLEYEAGGVGEYWIVDPLRQRVCISRRDEDGRFVTILDGSDGEYATPALPKFMLDVALLWHDELPSFYEIGDMARRMMTQ
jgi:Uma2 family endonuclease